MLNYYSIQVGARTIRGEARGEILEAQRAVAYVLVNRLRDGRWGKTLAEVARHPMQFSCWNSGDPNRAYCEGLEDCESGLLQAVGLLGEALAGLPDPSHGAKWYKNVGLAWPKDWGPIRAPLCTIGHLDFFDLDEKVAPK